MTLLPVSSKVWRCGFRTLLFECEFDLWDRSSPTSLPSKKDRVFYQAEEDLLGTMELAGNAIGLALYSFEQKKLDEAFEIEKVWQFRASAIVWLNIASDRLRGNFVMARFGVQAEKDDENHAEEYKKKEDYSYPFASVLPVRPARRRPRRASRPQLQKSSGSCVQYETEPFIGSHPDRGYDAVAFLKLKHEQADVVLPIHEPSVNSVTRKLDWREATRRITDSETQELRVATNVLKDLFNLLVQACALTFEFEYWELLGK